MRIGVRAHDLGQDTIQCLAEKIHQNGFNAAQLALRKAIVDQNRQPRELTVELAQEVNESFGEHDISLAVLGVYLNYATSDPQALLENYEVYKKHLKFAKGLGAKMLGTETGSIKADYGYTSLNFEKDAFHQWLKSLEKMVEWAEAEDVILGIEGVATHIVNTPERMKETLQLVPSKHLQVILDPINYLTYDNYMNQEAIMYYNFEHFGDKIQVIHGKDFIVQGNELKVVPAGKGLLNYPFFMTQIKQAKNISAIILEDIQIESMKTSKEYIASLM